MIYISPSIISADFSNLKKEIRDVIEAGADFLHCDIMDGHFVPNITIGPDIVRTIARLAGDVPLDIHLMLEYPLKYIEKFSLGKGDYITVHIESKSPIKETLKLIKDTRSRPGIVVNPDTEIEKIFPYLNLVDMVLIMSVHPGFSGQKMIEKVLDKVPLLMEERKKQNLSFLIELDGGINVFNAHRVRESGVDVIVSASAIFGSSNYRETIEKLRGSL